MSKKNNKSVLHCNGKVTMSGTELNKLLRESWDLGFMTGRNKTEDAIKEQSDDCLGVLREKYKTLKVEVTYAH